MPTWVCSLSPADNDLQPHPRPRVGAAVIDRAASGTTHRVNRYGASSWAKSSATCGCNPGSGAQAGKRSP